MSKRWQLGQAIVIAAGVHRNQYDKGGMPYILHPLHIMNQLLFDIELATIGVLHDVVEDSNGLVTIATLQNKGFNDRVCAAVKLLTHKKADLYSTYILGMRWNYDVIRVKKKDLEHNSIMTRLSKITVNDMERIDKYNSAYRVLSDAENKFIK